MILNSNQGYPLSTQFLAKKGVVLPQQEDTKINHFIKFQNIFEKGHLFLTHLKMGAQLDIGLDPISLNKYVVTLIKAQAKSCLTYNSLFVATPLPFIEKILLLLRPNKSENCRYNWSQPPLRELFFQKFVLSSIIRCLKI